MKPAKRLLSLLLALILCLSLVPLLPRAEAANVTINGTNFPDDNFRSYVEKYDKNNDGILSDAERNAVTEIACDAWGIRSLQGVEFFPA